MWLFPNLSGELRMLRFQSKARNSMRLQVQLCAWHLCHGSTHLHSVVKCTKPSKQHHSSYPDVLLRRDGTKSQLKAQLHLKRLTCTVESTDVDACSRHVLTLSACAAAKAKSLLFPAKYAML